jgi:anti-sigma B factor antagonist
MSQPRRALVLETARYADAAVVAAAGRVDHQSADELRAAVDAVVARAAQGLSGLVVDLTAADFVTSAGLRVLVLAKRAMEAGGRSVVICGPNEVVREVLAISRFDQLFAIAPSLEDALGRLSGEALAAWRGAAGAGPAR